MALHLPDQMKQAINILRSKNDELRKDFAQKNGELRKENAAQRSEIATLSRKIETLIGIRPVLNGPLAYDKITAFELWRDTLMYI